MDAMKGIVGVVFSNTKIQFQLIFFLIADATETIPNTNDEHSLVENGNHRERYHFHGFDKSMDETSNCSCENTKSSDNNKLSGSFHQINGLKNPASSANTETIPKSEANLKDV